MTSVQVQWQAVVYGHWATLDNILSCTTLVEQKSKQTEPKPMSLPLNHLSKVGKDAIYIVNFTAKLLTEIMQPPEKWYFVTKIVLTYCEKKLF